MNKIEHEIPEGYEARIEGNKVILEPKENEDDRIRKALISILKSDFEKDTTIYDITVGDIIAWLEKQDEQNLDNSAKTCKVEPKFKVGDWIISNEVHEDYRICKITNVEDGNYTIESIYGYKGYNTFETFEKSYHLWTIKDVKDGDVLVVNNEVFIYAHRKQMYSIAVAHCFVDSAGGFYLDGEFGYTEKGNSIHPATKEQRDLLFQKMKEAGYEWDAEKKELKKIEQNPTWSEEDEATIARAMSIVKWAAYSDHSHPILNDKGAIELVERLNSLKERYTWKPSDEQINGIECAIKTLQHQLNVGDKRLNSLYNDLKKLKE